MCKKIHIGIIGLGMVSQNHISGYHKAKDLVDIEAVCDVREELASSVAGKIGAKDWYTDYHKMLANQSIDAVDILLPHYLHKQIAIDAAESGKDILIEKPIARTSEEGESMVKATNKFGTRLMVANNLLFHPAVVEANRLISQGVIGKLSLVKAWSLGWFLYNVGISKYRKSAMETGGGCLIDTGTHFVYLFRSLAGDVKNVVCRTANILNHLHKSVDKVDFVPEGEDTAVSLLEFNGGALGELTVSYSTKLDGWENFWPSGWDQRLQIFGSEGAIFIDLPKNSLTMYADNDNSSQPKGRREISVKLDYGASFDSEIRHFAETLVRDGEFMKGVRGVDAVEDMKVIDAAYRSSKEKRIVSLV